MHPIISSISVLTLMLVNFVVLASGSINKYQSQGKIINNASYAKHLQSVSKGPFYIQAASFKEVLNADKYKSYLIKKFHQPVKIERKGQYYVVYVGPIKNAAAVRSLSQNILTNKPNNKANHTNQNRTRLINKYKNPLPRTQPTQDKNASHSNITPIKVLSKYPPPSPKTQHQQVNSSTNGSFYIRMASFGVISNAYKYKNSLIQKFHEPVVIKTQGKYQVVLIGPIESETKMRSLHKLILVSNAGAKVEHNKPLMPQAPQEQMKTSSYVPKQKEKRQTVTEYPQRTNAEQDTGGPEFLQKLTPIEVPRPKYIDPNDTAPWSSFPKVSIQGGFFTASQGLAQHINLNTLIGDDFSVSQNTSTSGLLGLGLYSRNELQTQYVDFSYGLNAYYLSSTQIEGLVTRENLFTTLSYNYSVSSWPVYFDGKALIHKSLLKNTSTVLDAGIGLNVINANSFHEYPLMNTNALPDRIFLNNTTVAFSATAGIGMRFNELINNIPFECGYRFFYLGQGEFGKATDQVLDSLKTGNSYANALICSITM